MTITAQDAAEALREAEAAEQRSLLLRGYQNASPHLILWGGIWAVGYTFTFAAPDDANYFWPAVSIAGTIAGFMIELRDHGPRGSGLRALGLIATFFLFVAGSIAVIDPQEPNVIAAFIPLLVAALYATIGLFGFPRLLITGAAVYVLTLFGFFVLPVYFLLWMAAVGGGGLILGGLWLRRV